MSDVSQRTIEDVETIAKNKGLVPFISTDTELFIDLDDDIELNKDVLHAIRRNGNEQTFEIPLGFLETTSENGGRHRYYRCTSLNPMSRIAIQVALGSDPIKEALSVLRVLAKSEAPIALFETPKEAKRVEAWRKRYKKKESKLSTNKIDKDPIKTFVDVYEGYDDVPF